MRRIPLLITIFTVAILVVAAIVIGLLYRAALNQQAALLSEIADNQARTIEGVARHEERVGRFVPDSIDHGDEFAATLEQLRDVNSRFGGFGHTGEFALARREGDSIVYLLNQRHFGSNPTMAIPFTGSAGEPMRRALSGYAGTVIGPDYRGVKVLAAYGPVNAFGMGVVAKIDVAEVQRPFVRAGLISIAVALVVVLLGSLLFYTITNPVLRQLQESETRMRGAQQLAHLGSWTLDLVKNKLTWSDEVYRIFGLRPQEFGANYEAFLNAVHPDDRAAVDAAYSSSVRENRDGFEIEHRIVRKSTGEIRIVRERAKHNRNASGRIIRSAGMVHDVTERRMAEDSLRRSEVTLRSILEATSESVWLFSTDGRILDANGTAAARFGSKPADVVGKRFEEILSPELSRSRSARIREVADSGRPVEFEDERAGMVFRHNFYPVLGSDGLVTAVVSFSRDITEARRAEQALRESESKFRIVADNTYDFEFWLGPNGKFVYVSPSCERITGYKPAEFLADVELLLRITHPEDRQLLADHQSAAGRRQAGGLDFRIVHRDGRVRWMGHVCQPILGPDGEFLGTRGSNRDITERKLAEEALRLSEQKFALAFAGNPAAIALSRLDDGLFLDVNETWVALTGYSRKEAIGHAARQMRIWPSAASASRFVEELKAKGALRGWEQEFLNKSGDVYVAELSAQVLTIRDEKVILSTLLDITARRRAEEALRLSEERFRAVASNTPDHILVQDHELRYEFVVNPQLGLTEQDMLGKTDYDFLSESDADRLIALKRQVMQTGKPLHVEVPLTSAKGELGFFDGTYVPRLDQQGRSNGVIGYFRNVTERKRAEEALRRNEATLRGILDATRESIWLFSANGIVLQANSMALARFGRTGPEVVGKSMEEILPAELAKSRRARLQEVVESARSVEFEDERAGILFRHSFYPVLDGEGHVLAVASFSRDITESRRAAEENARQLAELLRWQRVMLGREDRIMELKREVNELLLRLGESIRYPSQAAEDAETRG
jgi:PAS domain S-box-containing protein